MITAAPLPLSPALARRIECDLADEAKRTATRRYFRDLAALARPAQDENSGLTPTADPCPRQYLEEARYLEPEYIDALHEVGDEDRAFAFSAEGAYAGLCRQQTGAICSPERLEKSQREATALREMSRLIADRMKAAGWDPYRQTPFELYRYHIHSRHLEKLENYRRSCFIPAVAQQIRAPMVAALEYYLERNPLARFWTFTAGTRCALSEVRKQCQSLSRRLKKLNAALFMKAAGVRFVFRSIELGTPENDATGEREGGALTRNAAGELTFHPHAHVIVELSKGFVAEKQWSALLAQVGAYWRNWWGEGGKIRNAREACKYVTKPAEMLKLSGAELVQLQAQLSRIKLAQPMGSLAEQIKNHEGAGLRYVKVATADGQVTQTLKNWNRHARQTKAEKAKAWSDRAKAGETRGLLRVVSRGVPTIGPAGVSEPRICVMAMRGSWNEAAIREDRMVAPLIAATAAPYAAGVAARALAYAAPAAAGAVISVHTRTPTVPATGRGRPQTTAFWPSDLGLCTA